MADNELRNKWYLIFVYSGWEVKVRDTIMNLAQSRNLQDKIINAYVPEETVISYKKVAKRDEAGNIVKDEDGNTVMTEEKVEKIRKSMPGYVFVQIKQEEKEKRDREGGVHTYFGIGDDVWYTVRGTRGVMGFVGPEGNPTPVSDEEAARIIYRIPEKKIEETKKEDPEAEIVTDDMVPDETSVRTVVEYGFAEGDTVILTEGFYEGYEGRVVSINSARNEVVLMVQTPNRELKMTTDVNTVKKADA